MRDPARIDRICDDLKVIWKANPDQRFGQLIENLIRFNNLFPYKYEGHHLSFIGWNQSDEMTEQKLGEMLK